MHYGIVLLKILGNMLKNWGFDDGLRIIWIEIIFFFDRAKNIGSMDGKKRKFKRRASTRDFSSVRKANLLYVGMRQGCGFRNRNSRFMFLESSPLPPTTDLLWKLFSMFLMIWWSCHFLPNKILGTCSSTIKQNCKN